MERRKQGARPEPVELREGKITRIQTQRRHKQRLSIHIEGRYAFGLMEDVVARAALHVGKLLTVQEQASLLRESSFLYGRAVALELLAFKPRTASELTGKLLERGFSEEVAADCVLRCEGMGYIDDVRYAATFVRDRLGVRHHGPLRIRQDLQRRGVAEALIREALDAVEEEQVLEAARAAVVQVLPRLRRVPDGPTRSQRLQAALARKGFGGAIVATVSREQVHEAAPAASTARAPVSADRRRPEPRPAAEPPDRSEALALAGKRWEQLGRLESDGRKRRQKLQDFLRRRGVPFELVKSVMEEVATAQAPSPEPSVAVCDEGEDDRRFEEVVELALGRWERLGRLEPDKRKRTAKLRDFLGRRGIGFDVIGRVLSDARLS